jgi:hypothetical protein
MMETVNLTIRIFLITLALLAGITAALVVFAGAVGFLGGFIRYFTERKQTEPKGYSPPPVERVEKPEPTPAPPDKRWMN